MEPWVLIDLVYKHDSVNTHSVASVFVESQVGTLVLFFIEHKICYGATWMSVLLTRPTGRHRNYESEQSRKI